MQTKDETSNEYIDFTYTNISNWAFKYMRENLGHIPLSS